ncbi:MAG: dTDP-4-dehydrorhamnose reductase [Bilophila sp.]
MTDCLTPATPVAPATVAPAPAVKSVALVLGGNGLLGQALMHQLTKCGWEAHSLTRKDCDMLTPSALLPHVEAIAPDVIFNTVAWTQVDLAEDSPQAALSVNRGLPALLGGIVKGTSIHLVHFSTDFVFNGRKESPYTEEDKPDPDSVYGSSKLAGEQALLEMNLPNCCIVRTAWLFGPGRRNFVSAILEQARIKDTLQVVHDQIGSPTYTPDLACASVQLATRRATGLFHVVNGGQASWCELAAEAVRQATLSCTVRAITSADWPQKAKRPAYSVLSTDKYTALVGAPLRSWPQALREYVYTEFLSS